MQRFLEILLGLDPAAWTAGGEWRLEWLALPRHDAALIAIVAAVLGGWLILWLYRREGRGLAWGHRLGLATLRGLALLGVVVMLLEPGIVFRTTEWVPSNLIVLTDASDSMHLRDAYADEAGAARVAETLKLPGGIDELRSRPRAWLAERLLRSGTLDALAANGDRVIRPHAFAAQLTEAAPTTQPAGTTTTTTAPTTAPAADTTASAIGTAIRQALAAHRGQPLAGILVVTDGQSNAGEPPVKAAEFAGAEGVPIIALAAGTPEGPRNAKLAKLEASPVVYVRDPNAVRAIVESRGMERMPATIILERRRDGGPWEEVARQQVIMGDEGSVQTVTFEVKEDRPAKLELRATLAEAGPELTTDDNVALAEMRFIRQKIRVLFVAGSTFPEVEFIRNALLRDASISVSTWLQTADATYEHPGNPPIKRLPQTQEELNDFDAVAMYDPDPALWPQNFGAMLGEFVGNAGGGLVYVAGERKTKDLFDRPDDPASAWVSMLPVVVDPGLYRTDATVRLSMQSPWKLDISPEGKADLVFRFTDKADENDRILASLPGMFWHFPVTRAKPGATVLARHGDPRMRNEHGGHVLLATQLVGPGRTFFVGFDSTYRWRYLSEEYFDGFWARLVDRAGRSKQLGGRYPYTLATDRTSYRPGSQATLTATFENPAERDAGLDSLQGEIESGDGTATPLQLTPTPADPNVFEAVFPVNKPGPHFVRVWSGEQTAQTGARAATLQFPVELPNLEYERPGNDVATLQAMARASGGAVFTFAEADKLADAFKVKRVARVLEDRQEIWDAPLLWCTLLGAIFIEWVWRKRVRLV
jgi:hypothetical protein